MPVLQNTIGIQKLANVLVSGVLTKADNVEGMRSVVSRTITANKLTAEEQLMAVDKARVEIEKRQREYLESCCGGIYDLV